MTMSRKQILCKKLWSADDRIYIIGAKKPSKEHEIHIIDIIKQVATSLHQYNLDHKGY